MFLTRKAFASVIGLTVKQDGERVAAPIGHVFIVVRFNFDVDSQLRELLILMSRNLILEFDHAAHAALRTSIQPGKYWPASM